MPSTRRLTFTTAMWMVDRVHGDAAVMRTLSYPARASCFAPGHVFMIRVANLPDGRKTILQNFSRLARGQLDQRIVAFLRDQLRRTTRRTNHLRALARLQFNV